MKPSVALLSKALFSQHNLSSYGNVQVLNHFQNQNRISLPTTSAFSNRIRPSPPQISFEALRKTSFGQAVFSPHTNPTGRCAFEVLRKHPLDNQSPNPHSSTYIHPGNTASGSGEPQNCEITQRWWYLGRSSESIGRAQRLRT